MKDLNKFHCSKGVQERKTKEQKKMGQIEVKKKDDRL